MINIFDSNFSYFLIKYLSGKSVIRDKNIGEAINVVESSLIEVEVDVNFKVRKCFINSAGKASKGIKILKGTDLKSQFIKIVNDNLVKFLGDKNSDLNLNPVNKQSYIILLLIGLGGVVDKTKTCVKLALKNKKEGNSVFLVAYDT